MFGKWRRYSLFSITHSPAQKSACKDLKRNGQVRAITLKAAYTPTSNRAGSCSQKKSRFQTTPSSLRTTIQAVK
ncbi:hypothetical protein EFO71_07565 [Lacticaseibacillus rhamnosus]|nr:hypothetical protein [Lacticaseibacillus rhamnosus]MCT3179575.1 hypothetical protein [Lacticaseibacillus rhamnosus]MCT3184071.1 hypothetical protein [Lacticaseibacillus rhamnosus]MCT4448277.1 hypothetical protein [Lacticaseibacillus rhamnosus]